MSEYQITVGQFEGWLLRQQGERIEARGGARGTTWSRPPLRLLAKHYDVDSDVWRWLREHGVKRPSPSGPSGRALPPAQRPANANRRRIDTYVSAEAGARLDELARGRTVREALETLLLGTSAGQ